MASSSSHESATAELPNAIANPYTMRSAEPAPQTETQADSVPDEEPVPVPILADLAPETETQADPVSDEEPVPIPVPVPVMTKNETPKGEQPEEEEVEVPTVAKPMSHQSSPFQRIWTHHDEMLLLRALSQFQVQNGRFPLPKDYPSILSAIASSTTFFVTPKQLYNKIRTLKDDYANKLKQAPPLIFSQPHDAAVYKMCQALFQPSIKRAAPNKTGIKRKKGIGRFGSEKVIHDKPNNGVINGGDGMASHSCLHGLVHEMIHTHKFPPWLSTADDVVAQIGDSTAHDLNKRVEMLGIDALKLRARESDLMAELLGIIANGIANDLEQFPS